jgi:hypothetical protein
MARQQNPSRIGARKSVADIIASEETGHVLPKSLGPLQSSRRWASARSSAPASSC